MRAVVVVITMVGGGRVSTHTHTQPANQPTNRPRTYLVFQ